MNIASTPQYDIIADQENIKIVKNEISWCLTDAFIIRMGRHALIKNKSMEVQVHHSTT